ncbi:MAG TPA: hypothetical protein VFP58_07040 [Candidatus Eisenbacteria bacterium]|nr:hypothetical protein [Candidatus Eisenbacteria bacterium]
MKRFLFGTLILTLAAAGVLAVRWQTAERRRAETVEWTRFVMDSLGTSVRFPAPPEGTAPDSVYWQWVATTAQLQSRQWQRSVRHWALSHSVLLDEVELAQLRAEGLTDPVLQLRDSLKAHPELIPDPAVLGGTMIFVPGEHIVLLHRPYVFAQFSDGHAGGYMLLEYAVDSTGTITWKRLWSEST